MATIIKSISFQNFYNYYGDLNQNQYEFKEGINIVCADNNMGKSKFYNGVLWILNDVVYDSDSRKQESASTSFEKMASGKAKREENTFVMAVHIVVQENGVEYSIRKSVSFKRDKIDWNIGIEMTDVIETSNGQTIPIYDLDTQKKIIKKVIPTELLNYALLQGESMEGLVDLSSQKGLSSTIEILAGIKNLNDICLLSSKLTSDTKKLLNEKEKEFAKNNSSVEKLIKEKETLEEYIKSSNSKIVEYQEELSTARNNKEKYEALQLNATKREKFRGIKENIENEIKTLKSQKNEREKNITSMLFSGNSTWLLHDLQNEIEKFSILRDDWVKSKTTLQISKNPSIVLLPEGSPDIPSLKRMIRNEICEVCGRDAIKNSDAWNHIKLIMDRPQNENIISRNNFSQFFSNIQTSVGSYYNTIPEIPESIERYKNDIDSLNDKIKQKAEEWEDVKTEYLNVGGITEQNEKELTDKDIIASYSLAENKEIEKDELIKTTKKQIERHKTRITQIEDELNTTNDNQDLISFRHFKDTMCVIESIFTNTKDRIFDEIIKSLEINANEKYRELTHGNLTSGGKLCFKKQENNTVHVSIKDVQNGEITGLGTGFQRMKQLSIVMAIISSKIGEKQFNYPFISDAPFSEFGDNFINNFFKVAPLVFSQSIILIKELYDPNDTQFLNSFGKRILGEMKEGNIKGTFYVNVIEEQADTTNLVTKNKCYKN
jgi:DNA sulfur modification protein DndD